MTTRGSPASDPADYEAYAYDANDNRLTLRRRDGNTITATYDALNRETKRTYTNARSLPVYTSYDLGNRKLSELPTSTTGPGVSWAWDKASRKLSETTGTLALSIAYDADGNRASLTWPDGGSLAYMFSGADRFVQVGDTGGKAGVSLAYDPLGRLTSLTRLTAHATSVAYDAADRLTSLAQSFAGGVGNVAWTYAYTPASQIASSGASSGQFDWAGAAASTVNKTFDGLNRDSTVTALSGGYDANENLGFDGTRTFAYDGDNRLVSESAAGTSTTLAYDPTGRLQTQSTTTGGTTTQTTYLYDGDALVAEYNGATGTLLRRYAHGPGVDNPLIWYEGASLPAADARYLIADRQGSVIGYSDGGAVAASYAYDAYGAPSSWGGSRFRYTGQIEIPELQLYDYKARVYDPLFGHFLQTDPVGYKDDVDLYVYVGDDPIDHADPTGLTCTGAAGTAELQCHMDDPGKLKPAEVTKFNKAYTSAVRSLESHPNKPVKVTVDGKSFTVSAGQVAGQLYHATVTGTTATSKTADMETAGGAATGRLPGGAKETTVYRNALHDGGNLRTEITHEGLHMVPQESNVVGYGGAGGSFQNDHQVPYNNAADDLLKGGP